MKFAFPLLIIIVSSFALFCPTGVAAAISKYSVQNVNAPGRTTSNSGGGGYTVAQGKALITSFYYPHCDASCGNETWFANNIPPNTTSSFNPPVTTGSNITTWTLQTKLNTPIATYTVTIGATDDAGTILGTLDISVNVVSGVIPGGLWVSPGNKFLIQGKSLHFAAIAFPTNPGDPLIDHVNFTATWPGASWRVLNNSSNTVVTSVSTKACGGHSNCNQYSFDWNLANAGVPNGGDGPLTVSFDVYDKSNNFNLAPNGLHQEGTTWNPPLLGWQVIGYQPGQVDHMGRDFWAIDLFSNNSAVYPTLPGKVVFAGWNCQKSPGQTTCYGYVVVIDHGKGLYSIYTHLAATGLPMVDQSVSIKHQIGTMSDSGCSGCGIHLHFAVRMGPLNLGASALFGSNIPVRTPL